MVKPLGSKVRVTVWVRVRVRVRVETHLAVPQRIAADVGYLLGGLLGRL